MNRVCLLRHPTFPGGISRSHAYAVRTGWVTFRVRSESDLQHAVWLMRLSYFRYALKAAPDPSGLFAEACRELHLTAPFKDLLEQFVPLTNKHELAS